jgi:hypothetical protein
MFVMRTGKSGSSAIAPMTTDEPRLPVPDFADHRFPVRCPMPLHSAECVGREGKNGRTESLDDLVVVC